MHPLYLYVTNALDLDDRYLRTRKEDMPKGYLFNEAYYPPHGKNGHVYHVFVSLPHSPGSLFSYGWLLIHC